MSTLPMGKDHRHINIRSGGTLAWAPSKRGPLKGPLETKLCKLLSDVSSKKISVQIWYLFFGKR